MSTRTNDHFISFKQTKKACKRANRSAKRRFECKIPKNGNKPPFNSYRSSKTSSRTNIGPLKVNDKLVTEDSEMATILNDQFTTVFTAKIQQPSQPVQDNSSLTLLRT